MINRFGESVDILHPLDQPFTSASGASILQNLSFSQSGTNFAEVCSVIRSFLEEHDCLKDYNSYFMHFVPFDITILITIFSSHNNSYSL